MKEQNKLDKFFSDKLRKEEIEIGDWALPSDDVWEAAQKRFLPRKKKKNRLFLWLFFGLIVASSIVYTGLSFNDNFDDNIIDVVEEENSPRNNKNGSQNVNLASSLTVDLTKNENPEIGGLSITVKDIGIIENVTFANTGSETAEQSNFGIVSDEHTIEPNFNRNYKSNLLAISPLSINDFGETSNTLTSRPLSKMLSENEQESTILNERNNIEVLEIKSLFSEVESNTFERKLLTPELILIGKNNKYKNRSFGLSYLYLPITLLESAISLDDPDDYLHIDLSYFNLNLNYQRYFNPKWSAGSSIFLSKIDLKLNLSVMDTLSSDIVSFVNNEIGQVTPRNITEDKIELLDNVMVSEGDLIQINGNIDAGLQAIQIPVFLNRHWYKGNFNFSVGAGIGIDIVRYIVRDFRLDIYNDNGIIINKPILADQEEEIEIDYSIYANASLQYQITNNLNFGLALRASIREPLLSGFDLGLFYRWHK